MMKIFLFFEIVESDVQLLKCDSESPIKRPKKLTNKFLSYFL